MVILAVVVCVASENVLEVGGPVVLGSVSGVGVLLAAGVIGVLAVAWGFRLLLLGVGHLLVLGRVLVVAGGLLLVLLGRVGVVVLLLGSAGFAILWLVAPQLAVGVILGVAVGVGLDDASAAAIGSDMGLVGLGRVWHLKAWAGAWRLLVLGGLQRVALFIVANEAVVAFLGFTTWAQWVALFLGLGLRLVVGGWLEVVRWWLEVVRGQLELTAGHLEAGRSGGGGRVPVGVLGCWTSLHGGGGRIPEHGEGIVTRLCGCGSSTGCGTHGSGGGLVLGVLRPGGQLVGGQRVALVIEQRVAWRVSRGSRSVATWRRLEGSGVTAVGVGVGVAVGVRHVQARRALLDQERHAGGVVLGVAAQVGVGGDGARGGAVTEGGAQVVLQALHVFGVADAQQLSLLLGGQEGLHHRGVVVVACAGVSHWGRVDVRRGLDGSWRWGRGRSFGGHGGHEGGVEAVQAVGIPIGVAGLQRGGLGGLGLGPGGVRGHTLGGVLGVGAGLVDLAQVCQVGLVGATAFGPVLVLQVSQVDTVQFLNLIHRKEEKTPL